MPAPTRASLLVSICLAASPVSAPAAQRLWQLNSAGDDVHVIDVATLKVARRLAVGPRPHGIAAAADMRTVYISIESSAAGPGELIGIDAQTYAVSFRMPVCRQPDEIETTPDGRWVYIPCGDGYYRVIDVPARRVVATIPTGGRPHNTRVSHDGRYMYLSPLHEPKRVTVVDVPAGHRVAGEIRFRGAGRPPTLSADNTLFFQQMDGLNGFQVADIGTRRVIATVEHSRPFGWLRHLERLPWLGLEIFPRCHGLEMRPDQREIWSVCGKRVTIHDATPPDFAETGSLVLDGHGYWVTFTPDNRYAFIALARENKVAVVDAQTRGIVAYIDVGAAPKRNLVISTPRRTD
jgi:YVTN family beta-propeller protein